MKKDLLELYTLEHSGAIAQCYVRGFGVYDVITNFDTFAEAEECATTIDGVIISMCKRDGWHRWEYEYRAYEDYNMPQIYADDCIRIWRSMSEDEFIETEGVIDFLKGCDSLDDMLTYLQRTKELYNTIEDMDDNEIVVEFNWGYEVMPEHRTRYSEDVWQNAIAVISKEDYKL